MRCVNVLRMAASVFPPIAHVQNMETCLPTDHMPILLLLWLQVSNIDFLRMAANARRKALGQPELDPLEFYAYVMPKVIVGAECPSLLCICLGAKPFDQ